MKTFWWFFIAGFLNGVLIWIREQLKDGGMNAHQSQS